MVEVTPFCGALLGVERTPDPDTSGNRYAKLDLRYPTRLSAKVLISRISVYSILNVPFSSWAQCQSSENFCPIKRLGYNSAHSLKQSWKISRGLSNPHRVNPTQTRSWSQLTYPIPDSTQIFSVCSTPMRYKWIQHNLVTESVISMFLIAYMSLFMVNL